MKKRIYIIVGTRPNFIKVTQFKRVADEHGGFEIKIIHTGQHYDEKMADVFFRQFELIPDYFLNIDPASPNTQIAQIMLKVEDLFKRIENPDLLIVAGDVNSTLAAGLTANKLGVKLAHLESGLRSEDRTMPEEINRILVDEISDFFFVTEQSGLDNLHKEEKDADKIHFVGNTMIDTLVAFREKISGSEILGQLKIEGGFALMTMHRPATVDNEAGLKKLLEIIELITRDFKLVFPIHPRTLKNLDKFGMKEEFKSNDRIIEVPPLDYFAFQKLISESSFVITDSGGIQEETTFLQKPCLTLRPNTERPITITEGSNKLMTFDLDALKKEIESIKSGSFKKGSIPKYWDGKATERILEVLKSEV